ncbi:MAG: YeeE/YedE family protein [Gammaproteobacteria bacterium]|nr:YeeE/YedE family protein [Gammaproteobacteria bacterium]
MLNLTALLSGLVFGLGLILGGMTNPSKVIGFLDVAGLWDPSLALVMGGAIAVASVAFAVAGRRVRSLLGSPMQIPTKRDLDPRLIGGSLMFGAGWGLAGFCPGPALVALAQGLMPALLFVVAMLVGMLGYELWMQFNNSNRGGAPRPATGAH